MADNAPYLESGATISACGNYRYRLWREWRNHPLPAQWDMWTDDDGKPVVDGAGQQLGEPLSCVFVMLNPSTADGDQDDPTIRRCLCRIPGFADALQRKMAINRKRKWRLTGDGTGYHIPEEPHP